MRRLWLLLFLALTPVGCEAPSTPSDGEPTTQTGLPSSKNAQAENKPVENRQAENRQAENKQAENKQAENEPAPSHEIAIAASFGDVDKMPPNARRPRYSPSGEHLVFHAGAPGERDLYMLEVATDELVQLTDAPSDDRDPAFTRDGQRVVFSSNRGEGDDFDLYLVSLNTGKVEAVTDLPGDELEPAPSPLRYSFSVVISDSCAGSGSYGSELEDYDKVAFTRRYTDSRRTDSRRTDSRPTNKPKPREEIWFASMVPPPAPDADASDRKPEQGARAEHAYHRGRLSAADEACRSPMWSGDGLSVVWTCGADDKQVVADLEASWDQSFSAAIAAVRGTPSCDDWDSSAWKNDECLQSLQRRYSTYAGEAVSKASQNLRHPAVSANQVVLIAESDQGVVWRDRLGDGEWQALEMASKEPQHPVWSPDGTQVALDHRQGEGRTVGRIKPAFYLQTVRNLNKYPELVTTRSKRLAANDFVVRPGDEKEFYALHEKLRYDRREQYISADAALQAYRDEFQIILQNAEERAAKRLETLSKALLDHFVERFETTKSATDKYYATYFATAWAPLRAAASLPKPTWRDIDRYEHSRDSLSEAELAELEEKMKPIVERLPKALAATVQTLPELTRAEVEKRMAKMSAHEGIGALSVPSYGAPVRIDWSQFKVRGTYAESDLGAYFLAMMWYSQAPLPLDASMGDLADAMEQVTAGKWAAIALFEEIDAVVGAFMGKPVDATVKHVRALRKKRPKLFEPFDKAKVRAALAEMVGPIAIRNADSTEPGATQRKIQLTFFPQRQGLDATYFTRLTHPDVELRGMGSALDVFAVLEQGRAKTHALNAVKEASFASDYRRALDTLTGEASARDEGYFSTDIYHSWLAAVVTLAKPVELSKDSLLAFAKTDAFKDRQLQSALAGYTQLKHSAVLYAAQPYGVECDSSPSAVVLIEQPVLPRPRGFVDPMPEFFERLAKLAGTVYADLHDKKEAPSVHAWGGFDDTPALNAAAFAADLAAIAKKEVDGQPLSEEDYAFIDGVGERLEALTLRHGPDMQPQPSEDESRAQRGVAIATDIQTNLTSNQVLQIAVGRIDDMWVVVPDTVGQRMTQGGILSFYEFTQPIGERLTDLEWNARIEAGTTPERPAFTSSFFQDVVVE